MTVQQTHKLSTFKDFAKVGQAVISPVDVETIEAATNRLSPSVDVDPTVLLMLITAGSVASKFAAAIERVVKRQPVLEAGEAPRPAWADQVLAEVGLAPETPDTGPIETREQLLRRAAAAGIEIR